MAKTQFNADQLKTEAVKPLFAIAGATELAVELARGYAAEAQTRVAKVDLEPKNLQAQARTRVEDLVEELKGEAKDAQARFEARVADLQKDAKEFPAKFDTVLNEALEDLNATYADLQVRGEKFVKALRQDGVRAFGSVKPVATRRVTNPATKTTAPGSKPTDTKAAATTKPRKPAAAKKAPAKKAAKKAS
jgi:hypothetical protein